MATVTVSSSRDSWNRNAREVRQVCGCSKLPEPVGDIKVQRTIVASFQVPQKLLVSFLLNWNSTMLETIWKRLSYWYLQYELVTCLYVFEPWEKKLLNAMVVLIAALVCYSSYVYLPHYTMSLLAYFKIFEQDSIIIDYHYASNRLTTSM